MALKQTRFQIKDYLQSDEHFFFTRKLLSSRPPRVQHDHDHHEMFWIKNGRGRHWINGTSQELIPGTLVFIRPSDCHAFYSDRTEPLDLVNVTISNQSIFHLGERYASDLSSRYFWSDQALPEHIHLDEEQQLQLSQMEHLLENGQRSLARIEGFILEITAWIGGMDERYRHLPTWLRQGCEQATQPDVFRHGAKGLVEVCGRGHEHVCRAFQKYFGHSPSEHINQIRMAYAARQLSNSNTPIEDIAISCGIDNLSHFYREFKRHNQMTPGQYRKQYRRDPVQPD